jgi:hypothetical protein
MTQACCRWRFRRNCPFRAYLADHFPSLEQLQAESYCNRFEILTLLNSIVHSTRHRLIREQNVPRREIVDNDIYDPDEDVYMRRARQLVLTEAFGRPIDTHDYLVHSLITRILLPVMYVDEDPYDSDKENRPPTTSPISSEEFNFDSENEYDDILHTFMQTQQKQ